MSERKKVTIEYDEATGILYDAGGMNIGMWQGLNHFGEAASKRVSVRELVTLKEAGFSSGEIVEMREGGVI